MSLPEKSADVILQSDVDVATLVASIEKSGYEARDVTADVPRSMYDELLG